ncbi:hypothetical protein OG879_02285 [Streptomyces caniferus]|nr:hypothetical protein [Streptomyces caniferus]
MLRVSRLRLLFGRSMAVRVASGRAAPGRRSVVGEPAPAVSRPPRLSKRREELPSGATRGGDKDDRRQHLPVPVRPPPAARRPPPCGGEARDAPRAERTPAEGSLKDDAHLRSIQSCSCVAIKTGGSPKQVRFTVIVQYARYTKDKKYDAGKGQKIGVVNAFCRNQPDNKCPAWMNQ